MALFTTDTEFLVYMDSRDPVPTQHLRGRDALAPVFDDLNACEATAHFNGQSTVTLEGDTASGVTYCLAHHAMMVAASATSTRSSRSGDGRRRHPVSTRKLSGRRVPAPLQARPRIISVKRPAEGQRNAAYRSLTS